MEQKMTDIATLRTTEASIFKRLTMVTGTQRSRRAYANDLRDYAQFLGIEPASGTHPLPVFVTQRMRQHILKS